jgi:hypothetical protein
MAKNRSYTRKSVRAKKAMKKRSLNKEVPSLSNLNQRNIHNLMIAVQELKEAQ